MHCWDLRVEGTPWLSERFCRILWIRCINWVFADNLWGWSWSIINYVSVWDISTLNYKCLITWFSWVPWGVVCRRCYLRHLHPNQVQALTVWVYFCAKKLSRWHLWAYPSLLEFSKLSMILSFWIYELLVPYFYLLQQSVLPEPRTNSLYWTTPHRSKK